MIVIGSITCVTHRAAKWCDGVNTKLAVLTPLAPTDNYKQIIAWSCYWHLSL